MMPGPGAEEPVRITCWVRGHVQGVGFRWWVRSRALELRLVGSARNCPDGRVEVVAEGSRGACELLLDLLEEDVSTADRPGWVRGVVHRWSPARGTCTGFAER